MAGNKYLANVGGRPTEVASVQTSAGAADAGKIPALGASGRFHESMMPPGIGADTAAIQASENLAAGDFVNIWSDAGAFRVRKADATSVGKEAHGFVLAAVTSGENATVYFEGPNTQVTGAAPGEQFLSTTAGGFTNDVSAYTGGNVVQAIGVAVSATVINFERSTPIVTA
ncbi:MAG: hypothetical protein BWY57_01617 [Betaproteobacteria bacterium ADurb.Bin341]|nr:MAG: hypothetical protein BWY57_01617 [Betaproteobacteria bacterium ADurb.Bin341]